MSHNLATKMNGEYAFVSAHEAAWHKLGTVLDHTMNSKEALELGGLNYNVVKIQNTLETGLQIPDSYSLIRDDRFIANNNDASCILGQCGKQYHIVQNESLFSTFDFLVNEGAAIYETAGVLGNGERVWIMAKLPEDIVIGNKDVIKQYILITNAHTGRHAATVAITPVRVVCNNTLNMALRAKSNSVVIRHFSNATQKLQEAHNVLGFSTKYYEELKATYNKMAKTKMSEAKIEDYINTVFKVTDADAISSKKQNQLTTVMQLVESGEGADMCRGTLWGAMNAITEYADHHKIVRNGDVGTNALQNIWFGDGAKLKQYAMDVAYKFMEN